MRVLFVIIVSFFVSFSSYSNPVPKEFLDFYDYKKDKVIIVSPLGNKEEFSALYAYEGIKISDDNKEKLLRLLLGDNVKDNIALEIIEAISNSELYQHCDEQNVLTCSPADDRIYSFSYSYDKKMLKIFVSSVAFSSQAKSFKYAKEASESMGMITHVNTSLMGNSDSDISSFISLDSKANLNYGYINNYVTIGDDSELNELSYNLDLQKLTMSIGYYDGIQSEQDIISNYTFSPNLEETKLSISNNENLIIGTKTDYKRVYFNMPSNGYIKFYKNNKRFKSKHYSAGQNYIAYSELPYGNYKLKMEVIIDGKIQQTIEEDVFNTKQDFDGLSYKLDISKLKSKYNDLSGYYRSHDDFIYTKGSVLYGLSDSFAFLGELISSDNNLISTTGFVYNSFDVSALAKYTFIDDYIKGSRSEFYLNFLGFNLNFEKLKYKDEINENLFSTEYFGPDNYTNWGLSYNNFIDSKLKYFPSGTMFFNYNHMEAESGALYNNSFFDRESDIYSLSYNFSSNGYQYNIIMSKSYFEHSDDFSLSFYVDIPISNKWSATSGIYMQDGSYNSIRNEINYKFIDSDELLISSTAYNEIKNNKKATAGVDVDLSYKDNRQELIGSIGIDSNNTNVYTSYDTNILITKEDIIQTNKRNDSYIVIKSDVNAKKEHDFGSYELEVNDGSSYSRGNINTELDIIGTSIYNKYDIIIDTESSNLTNDGERLTSYFSHPGSIKYLRPDLSEIKTYIISFEDFNGESISDISCKGNGCSSHSEVGKGVFSLSIKVGEPFKILANNSICFINQEDNDVNLGVSKCFPAIKEANGMQLVVNGLGDKLDKKSYYLGIYTQDEIDEISNRFKKQLFVYSINNKKYVFWKPNSNDNIDSLYYSVAKSELDTENYVVKLK
ncbi:TcfC E-set like domain-containing protein [Photobacterium damselae]